MAIFAKLCIFLVACFVFVLGVNCHEFEHNYDTEEFTLKSKGILRPIVQLSEDNGVKRLLCKNNVILVAMDNMTYADDWNAGDIVVGGAEWACFINNDTDSRNNHVEFGFHRIIDSIEIKSEKRVDLYTSPAGLFDLFKEANIFYHHRTKDPVSLNTAGQPHVRKRRSVVPWKATGQDIPIDYDVQVKESFPGAGRVCYGDSDCTVNTTLSFFEVRELLDQVDFHKDFEQIIPINYNSEGDNSMGYFGYNDGAFVTNSSYFDDNLRANQKRSNPTDQHWEMYCEDCFMQYYPEVVFELEIDQLIGVKRYALNLSGPFETNINLKGSTSGEMSILLDDIFHRSPEHLWISIPLVEDISMFLTPKFNVTMDAHVDIKVTGAGEFQLGYDQTGNLTIVKQNSQAQQILRLKEFVTKGSIIDKTMLVRDWTQQGHIQKYFYEPEGSSRDHSLNVDVAGELFYNMSMMTSVIDIKADICWKLPKNIFGFYLTSPMQIRVEPNIIGRSVLDPDNIACAESEASVLSAIYLEDIKYDAELLGQKYDFLILPNKDNNTFYMQDPEPVISDREVCQLQCYGDLQTGGDIDDANYTGNIMRGDESFNNLMQLKGNFILFAPEAAGEGSAWCGEAGRSCLDCTHDIVGKGDDQKCSTRLVSRDMAVRLDKVANWVMEEWFGQDRKLYVLEAWNEPTEKYPDGKYGDESVYYEGRAAKIVITKPLGPGDNIRIDHSVEVMQRLSQMAVCAGFPYVKLSAQHVEVAVEIDKPYTSQEHKDFVDFFKNAPKQGTEFCDEYSEYFPKLSIGESVPEGTKAEKVLGKIDNNILRNNPDAFMNKMFYYQFDNVEFQCEEVAYEWCGSPTRECDTCVTNEIHDYAWTRCADRVMTPRLAAKLFHLADMVEASGEFDPSDKLFVLEAWDEPTSENPEGQHPEGSLHYEGRAVQLSISPAASQAKLSALSSLALCAGFDAVSYPDSSYIQATVKNQEGYFTVYSQFLDAQLLKVEIPTYYDMEYGYPEVFMEETRKTDLYDGDGEHGELYLSSNFQVKEFMCPLRRYLRVDKKLVECLQWTRDFVRVPIEILYGYKSRSYNLVNYEQKHENEKYRSQSGQAAEIRVTGYEDPDVLAELASAVLKSCSAQFRLEQHTLGIGFHSDRVYMHVKVSTVEELDNWLHVWNVDGDVNAFEKVKMTELWLYTGGPPVVPQSWETACDIPELGYDKHYLQVQVRPSCRDKSLEFCQHSLSARKEHVTNLKEQMNVILGFSDGPVFQKNSDVDRCIATLCGSCNGAGSTWRKKLVACADMLWSFKHLMYRELKANHTTFFNTDNSQSTVHGVACKNGMVCLENTQVYSVFAPIIMSTYRPDSDKAMEVRLYDSHNNPSPIIDLIEQEMAMRAEGQVHIYLEYERDLSALKKVVKILMALNTKVSVINFHVNKTVFLDQVYERIQDWIEVWRYDVCPLWGRAVLAPFTVDIIPEEAIAFGMQHSHDRNALQREMRNRDLAWILKM